MSGGAKFSSLFPSRFRLSTVLIGLLGFLSLIAVLAGYGVVRTGVQTTRTSQQRNREGVVRAFVRTVDLRLRTAEQLIQAGARRPGLILFLRSRDKPRVREVLRVICQETPYYRGAFVVTTDFETVALYGEPIEAQAIAHVKSRVTSGAMDAHFSRDGKLYSIAPIRYNESIIGYLVGDIALRRIAQDVAVPPDDGAFVAYVTRQGETITGSLSPNFNLTPPTVTTSDVMHRTHGDAYLATWGRAPAGGWIVLLTSQKVAAGLEGILRKVGILLLFLWIVFVAAAAIALKIWVISPVARIAHAARCVTEGDLVARAPSSSIRELDSLSVRFNAMTSRLVELLEQVQQDNVSLEERIRQRTSELAVALEKAEVASRAKDQFVATVSHELRTPLQGIVAASELLETKHPDETVRRNVNVIRASSRALRR
ncbi:MAG: histidine kinase dimerization/phospho-acceptor domain-containing protein, partial [Myxococcota bacterium]